MEILIKKLLELSERKYGSKVCLLLYMEMNFNGAIALRVNKYNGISIRQSSN